MKFLVLALAGLASAAPLQAAIFRATSANLKSVFAAAAGGDTIILSGSFGFTSLADRSWTTPVRIDARAARFGDSLLLKNVSGVSITGGSYGSTAKAMRLGRAISVSGGSRIAIAGAKVSGNRAGVGIGMTGSRDISVSGAVFTGLKAGLTLSEVRGGTVTGNKSLAAASDGFNFAGSQFITARGNLCSGTVITAGAHPDCIQMWSIAGKPVTSDISLFANEARGATQGFTLFGSAALPGLRIVMKDNIVATSYPQGIACYGCSNSVFTGNRLTTLPGSRFRTSINIVGGSNNIISGNTVGAKASPLLRTAAMLAPADDSNGSAAALVGAVPEPEVWAQLIVGFGLLGALMRRRRLIRAVLPAWP